MKFRAYFRSLAARFLHRSQVEDDMEAELRSHIQHRADDLERSGLNRGEAERRARIEFGGREKYKEEIHQAAGGNFIGSVFEGVRYSLRVLGKSPGLAIGANAVVFAVLNALILRPLNVPRADSLYTLEHGYKDQSTSYPDYLDL